MPDVFFAHDDQMNRLKIEVELPGVDKKDISLDMRKDSFCVSAPRGEDTVYSGCYILAHQVMPERAEAKYDSGLLKIVAPIKNWEEKVNVTIR
jgi:HSP20 family molecular chaperone IbpA